MTTSTLWVHGPLANDDGVTMWPAGVYGPDVTIERYAADHGYLDEQPSRIPVRLGHAGPTIGEVVHLEHRHRQLFAVAEIDADKIDPATLPLDWATADWYWSSGTERSKLCDRYHVTDSTITDLSLTTRPASVSLRPLQFSGQRPGSTSSNRMLRRAAATIADRRHRCLAPLRIERLDDHERRIVPTAHRAAGYRADGIRWQNSAPGRILSVS